MSLRVENKRLCSADFVPNKDLRFKKIFRRSLKGLINAGIKTCLKIISTNN